MLLQAVDCEAQDLCDLRGDDVRAAVHNIVGNPEGVEVRSTNRGFRIDTNLGSFHLSPELSVLE